uniref:Uncharacterized protein n=1 Tax=Oryza punctata TaxID=4537 RepID=A0A0E0KF57_ORYPU
MGFTPRSDRKVGKIASQREKRHACIAATGKGSTEPRTATIGTAGHTSPGALEKSKLATTTSPRAPST